VRHQLAVDAGRVQEAVLGWGGRCEVHEKFTVEDIRDIRKQFPDVVVLAHPECPQDVLAEADFVGSTSGMIRYVGDRRPAKVVMITECSMSDNVAVEYPDVELVRPCNLCPHMKRITLPKILRSLRDMTWAVEVEPEVARRARRAVDRMLEVGRGRGQ